MSNEALVAELIRTKVLKTPHIIETFLNVDRGDFVLPEHIDFAYEDKPLPLVDGATISQPRTVAIMLELLQPQPNQKILDIGTGSGWTTALLAECVGPKGKIYGTEIKRTILDLTKINLEKYPHKHTHVLLATEVLGYPNEAPYDGVLVSAAAESLPHDLTAQLKIGGIMVIPIQHSLYQILRISDDEVEASEFPGFSFVPLK